MTRKFAFACILGVFIATCAVSQTTSQAQSGTPSQPQSPAAKAQQQPPADEDNPPEEDDSVKPKVYTYDPLEAERNIKVGNFYMRQGSRGYRAAAGRFEDATKYDPKNPEAFFRLGEVEEKLKHKDRAEAAFHRVIALSPESKLAKEAQKKLAHVG